MHIASAVIGDCDLIISWNFKHLVNYNTIKNAKSVNAICNYHGIDIISPTIFVGGDKDGK